MCACWRSQQHAPFAKWQPAGGVERMAWAGDAAAASQLLAVATSPRDYSVVVRAIDTQRGTLGEEARSLKGGALSCCWRPNSDAALVRRRRRQHSATDTQCARARALRRSACWTALCTSWT